jgi:phosphonate transport system substrate-binding protein
LRGAWLVLALLTAGCGVDGKQAPEEPSGVASTAAGVLRIGSVSLTPTREHEVIQPFADYVASRLGEFGIGHGRVVVVDSLNRMVSELAAGRVDLYFDSPFPVAFVARRSGSLRVLLRRWKRGSENYRSVIFCRSDSGAEDVRDLRGRMVAFGAPFSTSAFLLPKALLASGGLDVVGYQDASAPVSSDRVGYVFSDDAENTMFWVLKGKVAAGAVNEDYYAELAGNRAGELRILARSPAVPRNFACCRADLDPALADAIVNLLLGMTADDAGVAVLRDFEGTAKFDRFPEGAEQALADVTDLLSYVEEDLGP